MLPKEENTTGELDLEESEIDFESLLEDLDNKPNNAVSKFIEKWHLKLSSSKKQSETIKRLRPIILLTLFNVYFGFAIYHHLKNETDIAFCNGVGFFLICGVLANFGVVYYKFLKKWCDNVDISKLLDKSGLKTQWTGKLVSSTLLVVLLAFLIWDTRGDAKRLTSVLGLFLILLCGLVISKYPGRVDWNLVIWGIAIQFLFGILILRWPPARFFLQCLSDKIASLLHFVLEGSSFVYGYLATELTIPDGKNGTLVTIPGVFAFRGITSCYLFTFLVEVLYHYDIMTWVVANMGWLLEITVGTTAVESMTVAANIFLGITTAPLVVRPFIARMTNSEIHAMMTGGFATVAGAAFGVYVGFGINAFHLLAASFMSAPASLVFAKILLPETKKSLTSSKEVYAYKPVKSKNAIDAGVKGAVQAVFLVANIIASIIAILAAVGLCNHIVNWLGKLVGFEGLSFEWIVAQLFVPFAWCMGIDNEEIAPVAKLLGTKTVINEFVAYAQLTKLCLSPRTVTITTYALCCFANLGSIGVTLGGLTAICPQRAKDVSKIVMSAFVGGNAAALLTACVAGALTTDVGYHAWLEATGGKCTGV